MKLEKYLGCYPFGEFSVVERRLWFVRQNGKVNGPFLSAQITRNILLGRIRTEDELSRDKKNWREVAKHRELYPDVMLENPVDEKKLDIAKIQVDERIVEQRRLKENMAEERRRTRDRRENESDMMLLHRENRRELLDAYNEKIVRAKLPTISIVFSVIVIIVFGFVLNPEKNNTDVDCSNTAKRGVNWSNCQFVNLNIENKNLAFSILTDASLNDSNLLGVNLSDSDMAYAEITASDLSYANLERARLIGANLNKTDLRYANLKDADLSYADLSGAMLAGANTVNTRFDNTIWTNGQLCQKGSVGSCERVIRNESYE